MSDRVVCIGEDYEIHGEQYGWMLSTRTVSQYVKGDKEGMEKVTWTPRYYPTFQQCAKAIVQEEASHATDVDSLIGLMQNVENVLANSIEMKSKAEVK